MAKSPKHPMGDYVRSVTEETRLYLNELKHENEALRTLVARLEAERGSASPAPFNAELTDAQRSLADREHELERANQELRRLREQLISYEQKEEAFQEQLAALERQAQEGGRHVDLERRLTHLCSLYVASYRLHESLTRKDVLAAISEVLANSVGCEVFGIFECQPNASSLALIGSMGIDERSFATVKLADDPTSRAIRSGETRISSEPPHDSVPDWEQAFVCVPFKLPDQSVNGAIVLFELLPQKPALEPVDHEIFQLLSSQGALALLWSRASDAIGSGPMA